MTIKYYLANNPVSRAIKNFIARIVPNAVLSLDDIIQLMLKRGTSATEADIRHILFLFFDVASDEVKSGNFVNTPLANFRPGITGTAESAASSFDASRNTIKASISQGILLEQKMATAQVEKITQPIVMPTLLEFDDAKSKTANSIATPGNIGTIIGDDLKFNADNLSEGVFFINTSGVETRADVYSDIYESNVKFNIPVLATGAYNLEVRRAYTKDNVIRRGSLQDFVTVA